MIPKLIGVIHLPALPASPRFGGDLSAIVAQTGREALILQEAGYDAVIVENFGDVPFVPGRVDPVTVAAMTACGLAARAAAPRIELGINVLRNDAWSALGIALATGATLVRVNVHSGARVTDQGVVQGEAHVTLRRRRELGLGELRLLCDVAVKHSAPLGGDRAIDEEAHDVASRGLADAVLLTGTATGRPVRTQDLLAVAEAVDVPVLVASGVTPQNLAAMKRAHGVIVGSWLRASGRAGEPIDPDRAREFAEAFAKNR